MIAVKNLTKTFKHQGVVIDALKDVNFDLDEGKTLSICGRSGAGKSTLLNLLGGLDCPSSGHVVIHDKNITEMNEKVEAKFRNKNLGFIFQFHHLLKDFTILENVMMPLMIQKKNKKSRETVLKMLERVGIEDKIKRYPQELSGGEQQRAAIARALVHNPKIILADEPTGNLDEANSAVVFELLCRLNRDLGSTLIVVTHNMGYAKMMDHCLTLEAGRVADFH